MARARAGRTGSRDTAALMVASGIGELPHSACEIYRRLQLSRGATCAISDHASPRSRGSI
jgi:hypothetical protein